MTKSDSMQQQQQKLLNNREDYDKLLIIFKQCENYTRLNYNMVTILSIVYWVHRS